MSHFYNSIDWVTVCINVGVVDLGGEGHLGGLEGVVCGEVDGEEEDAPLVRTLGWAHDGCLPVEQILPHGACRALGWWVPVTIMRFGGVYDVPERLCRRRWIHDLARNKHF